MIKKSFIKEIDCHKYGKHTNAIFFDYKDNGGSRGFKYMVYAHALNCSKKFLIDILYEWVTNEVQPPYFVSYKYASTDEKRFKVPICLNINH